MKNDKQMAIAPQDQTEDMRCGKSTRRRSKAMVKLVAVRQMTESEERRFNAAFHALLLRWADEEFNYIKEN